MVYFPVRKCYYIAKVSLLLVLVVTILGLFEKWRGGKRAASAMDSLEQEYEKAILEDEARIIPGLGEGGVAAYLTGEDQKLGEKSEKKLAMNVYLSERIAYNRTLKDQRNAGCERVTYDAELPSTSVILIFHNEPYSVVIRTIWSVINSCRRENPWFQKANFIDRDGRTMKLGYPGQDEASPLIYLKEIILVDDNSTLPELKGKLSHYARTRLPPDLIRILRLPDRVGLTRARLAGARYATGSVLVFLDSHCEAQIDWLRPQLQILKDRPHTVVMPIIDSIDQSNFFYSTQEDSEFQGLMKARIRGARSARGDVLIFLDAHCEAQYDWMRPMIQRVKEKRDTVVTPIIDVLDQSTFRLDAAEIFQVGGFTFTGHFTWIDVSPEEKKRRGSEISPTWSPTMAGGLFAINREYYWELGAYDEQMAGWGGENLEMSFRIWQCGGTLETIPCSRVGHVFRSFHPYSMPANSDTHGINTARMAEVWMDEYAELFYLHRPDLRNNPKIGDVTHRKVLREKLRCKNFQWFLDNIYKEKFVPVRDAFGYGRFRNPATNMCIDTMQREDTNHPLGVYQCHPTLQATQYFSLSLAHQLRDEENCAQIQFSRPESSDNDLQGSKVVMSSCHGTREQKWQLLKGTRQLQHMESRLCLDAGYSAGADLMARPCSDADSQRWEIDYSEENHFKKSNEVESSELERKLSRLRGQRRKSRALLSINTDKRRHHKKKHQRSKKSSKNIKTKNKFILKLIRTLMNYTDEHLEMDIYCKHHQLYPNNTFVRDLVTILNERNIKVINNGRVFERNKVTQLDPKKDEDKKILNILDIPQDKTSKKKHLRKPSAIAPDVALEQSATDQPGLKHEAEDRAGLDPVPADGSETSLSPRSHRIIIEDFIQMSPTTSTTARKNKKKRKHKRVSSPLINSGGNGDKREGHLPDRSIEEQIGDQIPIPMDSIEDAPMLSESETNAHVTKPAAKQDIKRKRKKHGKLAKRTGYETNEHERDSLQPIDKESDIEVWNVGESKFRADDMGSQHDIPKNTQYIAHSTPEPETEHSPEVTHTKHRKHNSITDEALKDTQKHENTDEPGKDKSRKPDDINNMWRESQKPEVVYQKEWLDNEAPEVVHQLNELDPRETVKSIYGSAANSSRRAYDPEAINRKQTPEVLKQTVGHRARNSETDRQTDNDSEKTHEEWSGEVTESSVKVVMKSNLTFNLGDEFFKWRTDKENKTDSEKPLSTKGTSSMHAWQIADVTHPSPDVTHSPDDVTHSSDEVPEPDGKDSGDRSNSSSESASSE